MSDRFFLILLSAWQGIYYGFVAFAVIPPPLALVPWLLRHDGYVLYRSVVVQYFPGDIWLQMLLAPLIPDPPTRLRLLMICVAVGSTLLCCWISRQLSGRAAGRMSAALYAVLLPFFVMAPAYFEIMAGACVLAALALAMKRGGAAMLGAGIVLGVGTLMKQQALVCVIPIALFIWEQDRRGWRRGPVLFAAGLAAALLIAILIVERHGLLGDAFFWTVTYNRDYYAGSPGFGGGSPLVVMWLALGLIVPLGYGLTFRKWALPLLAWSFVAFAIPAIQTPRLVGSLAVIAILGAALLREASKKLSRATIRRMRRLAYGLLVVFLGLACLLNAGGNRQWDELKPVAEWVRARTALASGARFWVVQANDVFENFYQIAGYLPPRYWIPTHGWFQRVPGVTEALLASVEADAPRFALYNPSLLDVPPAISDYLRRHYDLIDSYRQFGLWQRRDSP